MASPDLVDRLSVDYHMWNAYVDGRLSALADPVRLPRRDLDELAALSERFARLIDRTIDLVRARPSLLSFYGFGARLRRMLDSETAPRPVTLARYDAFRTPDGWKFSEFNCDVPGGIHEGAGLNDLIGGDPSRFRVVDLLVDSLCRDTVRPAVAICYASGFAEDLEQCQFLRREWGRVGIRAVLCNPENLVWNGRDLRAFGEKIDLVYRFFPVEWMTEIDNLDALLSASRSGRLPMINGFWSLVAQSKKTMALWHEHRDLFDASERDLIVRHVPRTEAFRIGELGRYRRERERLVVKRQFGRIGEEVLLGSRCSDPEWADWLAWPASEPQEWIVQDRFDPLPIDVGGDTLYGCFGPYVVDGRFGGLYNRFARDGFIAFNALVGAVVEE
ncbi:MAG TPA: glutathionylspermidine synthase family protein [Planctomycetota bacterium]|nr:glutathionylspermidine synthase family protein [Planctomycetota bacterium]